MLTGGPGVKATVAERDTDLGRGPVYRTAPEEGVGRTPYRGRCRPIATALE